MTNATLMGEPAVVPGSTNLTARALQHLALGIARDAARVQAKDVAVALSDDQGALRIAVTVPFAITPGRATTIVEDGAAVRQEMIARMEALAGRTVKAVDVRYSGVSRVPERRVR